MQKVIYHLLFGPRLLLDYERVVAALVHVDQRDFLLDDVAKQFRKCTPLSIKARLVCEVRSVYLLTTLVGNSVRVVEAL